MGVKEGLVELRGCYFGTNENNQQSEILFLTRTMNMGIGLLDT